MVLPAIRLFMAAGHTTGISLSLSLGTSRMATSVYLACGLTFLLGCSTQRARVPQRTDESRRTAQLPARAVLVDSTVPAKADDGQWTMAARDYANTRYSGLDQITAINARNLHVAWTFSTG